MTLEQVVLSIGIALIGGSAGAVVAARIQGAHAVNAASIAADAAKRVGELHQAESREDRLASQRAWVSGRTLDVAEQIVVLLDLHGRQARAQQARRHEAASDVRLEPSIPRLDETDPIRDLVFRLSHVGDEPVVEAALAAYKAAVDVDHWRYDAAEHFRDGTVIALTPEESVEWGRSILVLADRGNTLLNAVRVQVGQPALDHFRSAFDEPAER